MSNALQVPAHLLQRKSRLSYEDSVRGIGGNSPPHLSIKDNRFTLIDAAGNEKAVSKLDDQGRLFVDVVIADMNRYLSRAYYEGGYNPQEKAGPLCFSENGATPSQTAAKPQCATCAGCPKAVWGSAVSAQTGQGVPACKEHKKLALILAKPLPGIPNDKAFLFRIPGGSLKAWREFSTALNSWSIGERRANVDDVIMRITFIGQGLLHFAPVELIDLDMSLLLDRFTETQETALLVGALEESSRALPPPSQTAPPLSNFVQAQNTLIDNGFVPQEVIQPIAAALPSPPAKKARIPKTNPEPVAIHTPPMGFGMTDAPAPDSALMNALAASGFTPPPQFTASPIAEGHSTALTKAFNLAVGS